jgi:hypothetical protein
VCSSRVFLYCVMVSRLWSSRILSGCRRSSSLRHCCMVLFIFCQRHKYDLLIACAPHLSFLVVVFSFIILCMACPNGGSICCVFARFVGGGGCMVLWGV